MVVLILDLDSAKQVKNARDVASDCGQWGYTSVTITDTTVCVKELNVNYYDVCGSFLEKIF